MPSFKTRHTEAFEHGLQIEHKQGGEADARKGYIPGREGDVTLNAGESSTGAFFQVSLYEDRGRDRDNYAASWDIDFDLDEDEARELLLALTVWLERKAEAAGAKVDPAAAACDTSSDRDERIT